MYAKKSYICKQITSTSQFPVCKNKIQGATRNPIWNFFLIVNEILKLILLKKMMMIYLFEPRDLADC